MKTAVLFSGGKDSFFSLQIALEKQGVDLLIGITSKEGDTQLHAGIEGSAEIRRIQLELLGLPHEEIIVHSGKDYLHDLFIQLKDLVQKHGLTHLVTGDLWHPYTSGIADMLAGALGVELLRPARDICFRIEESAKYMESIFNAHIQSIIVSVRKGDLDQSFVGREINSELLEELESIGVDVAAEGGEYQSLVLASPVMKGRIIIDDYGVELVDGKNKKEQFYHMKINKFHLEQ